MRRYYLPALQVPFHDFDKLIFFIIINAANKLHKINRKAWQQLAEVIGTIRTEIASSTSSTKICKFTGMSLQHNDQDL